MAAQVTGLRLCGIVLEPPFPSAAPSKTSPTSVCINNETSLAILPKEPVKIPNFDPNSFKLSLCDCHENEGLKPKNCANEFITSLEIFLF